MVLFVHLALDVQIEDTFHSGGFHRGRHPSQQTMRFYIGEILVYQTVGGNNSFAGDDSTLGEGGPVADPDVLAEDNGLGQRSDFPILVEILHVVEGRVHELAVPCGAHIAANDNPVEAENLEVGTEIDFPFAKLQRGVVGDHHVGAVSEDDGSVEDDSSAHRPNALLDGGVDVEVVLPDPDHSRCDRAVDEDFSSQTAEGHLAVQPHWQFLRHRKWEHLEVEPEGFDYVDGSDDVE